MSTILLNRLGTPVSMQTSSTGISSTDFSGELDENGQFVLELANADTYKAGAWFQEDSVFQSGICRIDEENTDELVFQADAGALAEGKIIAGQYWLSS